MSPIMCLLHFTNSMDNAVYSCAMTNYLLRNTQTMISYSFIIQPPSTHTDHKSQSHSSGRNTAVKIPGLSIGGFCSSFHLGFDQIFLLLLLLLLLHRFKIAFWVNHWHEKKIIVVANCYFFIYSWVWNTQKFPFNASCILRLLLHNYII